jgi:hypothetical protein
VANPAMLNEKMLINAERLRDGDKISIPGVDELLIIFQAISH